jgi:hypothetical protein
MGCVSGCEAVEERGQIQRGHAAGALRHLCTFSAPARL